MSVESVLDSDYVLDDEDATWIARRVLPLLGVAVVLAVWWIVTHTGGSILTRMVPERSFAALAELGTSPTFYAEHVTSSLFRFGVAIALSVAIGLPLGMLAGYFELFERTSSLVFQFLRIVSPIAWFPIAVAVFGSGTPAAVFVIFMAGVWPIVFNTAHGIDTMQKELIRVGESLGGDTRAILRKVVFPAVVPDVLNGLRISVGIAWIILVPAEMLGVDSGLGYYLLHARDRFAYHEIPAVIIVIGVIGFLLDTAIRRAYDHRNWN
jgi:NitT/TauT family transport system permease protein